MANENSPRGSATGASDDPPPGISYQGVQTFLSRTLGAQVDDLRIELVAGGSSNLTYLLRGKGSTWVLRRPPLGFVLPTAHDMQREFTVLSALRDSDVPVPKVVGLCVDPAVIGCPFYVMEYCEGVVPNGGWPAGFCQSPAQCQMLSIDFVEGLARLHRVNFKAVGLADFGRPEGYLARQVERWIDQWKRASTGDLPEVDELARRLRAAVPPTQRSTIVHGDYRLGNVVFARAESPYVRAILDWEMATIGDPLADLGYTLIYWSEIDDLSRQPPRPRRSLLSARDGFLTREELVNEYSRRTGFDVHHVPFYEVLALFKLGVITEGIYARYLQGKTVGARFAGMTRQSPTLFLDALEIAGSAEDAKLRGRR